MKLSIKTLVPIIILMLTLAFIWGNSIIGSVRSNSISDAVTEKIGEITAHPNGEKAAGAWLTSEHIRKMAHVIEYVVLGAEITLFFFLCSKTLKGKLPTLLLIGVCSAMLDETLQLFNDRSAMIKDIWIDFGGYIIGMFLMLLICNFISNRRKRKIYSADKKTKGI